MMYLIVEILQFANLKNDALSISQLSGNHFGKRFFLFICESRLKTALWSNLFPILYFHLKIVTIGIFFLQHTLICKIYIVLFSLLLTTNSFS